MDRFEILLVVLEIGCLVVWAYAATKAKRLKREMLLDSLGDRRN